MSDKCFYSNDSKHQYYEMSYRMPVKRAVKPAPQTDNGMLKELWVVSKKCANCGKRGMFNQDGDVVDKGE